MYYEQPKKVTFSEIHCRLICVYGDDYVDGSNVNCRKKLTLKNVSQIASIRFMIEIIGVLVYSLIKLIVIFGNSVFVIINLNATI